MNRNRRCSAIAILLLLSLALLLVGCQRDRPAADDSAAWDDAATTPAATPATASTETPGDEALPVAESEPGTTVIAVEGGGVEAPASGSSGEQPGVQVLNTPAAATPQPVPVVPDVQTFDYVVSPGDTLFSIAQTYGADVETLRRINNLPDDTIQSGQVLKVPGSGQPVVVPPAGNTPVPPAEPEPQVIYTVQSGDTISSIAADFGVNWQELAAANGIAGPNYTIYRGQKLVVPGVTPTPVPTVQVQTHTVSAGETLYSIAISYGKTLEDLMQANQLSNPDVIYQGQILVIPD